MPEQDAAKAAIRQIPIQRQIVKAMTRLASKYKSAKTSDKRLNINTALTLLNSATFLADSTSGGEQREARKLLDEALNISRLG